MYAWKDKVLLFKEKKILKSSTKMKYLSFPIKKDPKAAYCEKVLIVITVF